MLADFSMSEVSRAISDGHAAVPAAGPQEPGPGRRPRQLRRLRHGGAQPPSGEAAEGLS
jgi:hypothetical protein